MRAHATPRVSMAVPVYNGERYLGEALDSLLAQTYHDFELIICDNASTDGTGEIARSYASMDERVRYVRNERNLGLAGNVKRAFQLSSGEYFRWHAADDVCAPQFLARCVAVRDRHPAVVLAYPRTQLIDADGRVTATYDDGLHLQAARPSMRFQQLLERVGYVNAQFGLLRAEVLLRTGLLGSYPAADVVFVAQLSLHGTFWEVPSFLFYRRFHPGAASRMDRAQLRVVWDPTSRRRVHLPEWRYLLELARAIAWAPTELAYVGFYDKPLLKFERILETYLGVAPKGFTSFRMAGPVWLKEKLFTDRDIHRALDGYEGDVLYAEHHESHAASAFFPSPFAEAAILTVDGVGEWATAAFGVGRGDDFELFNELHWPDSLGLLYSAFTYYSGFKVNSGEYKLMGLAPYGEPAYAAVIYREL